MNRIDLAIWVHDTILRRRINAAFRRQVERRIYAAEGVPEEICPAPWPAWLAIALYKALPASTSIASHGLLQRDLV